MLQQRLGTAARPRVHAQACRPAFKPYKWSQRSLRGAMWLRCQAEPTSEQVGATAGRGARMALHGSRHAGPLARCTMPHDARHLQAPPAEPAPAADPARITDLIKGSKTILAELSGAFLQGSAG